MRDTAAGPVHVQVGRSQAARAAEAVIEAAAALTPGDTCFVLAFVPDRLNSHAVAQALEDHLRDVPVYGCTTAGQITPEGYEADALLLLGFSKAHFRCEALLFENLNPVSPMEVATTAQRFADDMPHAPRWNRLGLVFADGLSKQEDLLISTLEAVLYDLPIFGGSAGDGMRFQETFLLHQGRAVGNAALFLLIETDLPFQGVGFDHFRPDGPQLVITGADPEERLVSEINGAPAAQEYARLVGCDVADLSPQVFAENPLMLRRGTSHYARAIEQVADGHTLSLLAAIDDGLIMTLGCGRAILETLETGLSVQDPNGQSPDFILGFDCVLRRLEIEQKNLLQDTSALLRTHRVLGFNTFGEQQSGLHMNQTFVGVAFFDPAGTRV